MADSDRDTQGQRVIAESRANRGEVGGYFAGACHLIAPVA